MSRNQIPLFEINKARFPEQVDLTVKSIIEYGSRHDHWAAAWSMEGDVHSTSSQPVRM